MSEPQNTHINFEMNRRDFFGRFALGMGGVALTNLFGTSAAELNPLSGLLPSPHLTAKAKRIIDLVMSSGPTQRDLADNKPKLNERNGQDLPESTRMGQRFTTMTSNQARLPMASSAVKFALHG